MPSHSKAQHAYIVATNKCPIRTTFAAPQHHPFGGGYASKGMTCGQGWETGQGCVSQAQDKIVKMTIITGNQAGLLMVKGCGELAEFLAQAPWQEQRDGMTATQPELAKHLNLQPHKSLPTEMLEILPLEAIPTGDSKILQKLHRILKKHDTRMAAGVAATGDLHNRVRQHHQRDCAVRVAAPGIFVDAQLHMTD